MSAVGPRPSTSGSLRWGSEVNGGGQADFNGTWPGVSGDRRASSSQVVARRLMIPHSMSVPIFFSSEEDSMPDLTSSSMALRRPLTSQCSRSKSLKDPGRGGSALLSGVSLFAEAQNQQVSKSFSRMFLGEDGDEPTASTSSGSPKRQPLFPTLAFDEQGFLSLAEKCSMSIDGLRKGLDAFAGKEGEAGNAQRRGEGHDGQEEREKRREWRERLEAFKMVRKVEGELPPLSNSSSRRSKSRSELEIVKRNMMPEVLGSFSPDAKKARQMRQRDVLGEKIQMALSTREDSVAVLASKFEEKLAKKRQQALRAIQLQKDPPKKESKEVEQKPWFIIVAILKAAASIHQAHEVGLRKKAARQHRTAMAFSVRICVSLYVRRLRARLEYKKMMQSALIVSKAMHGWRVYGPMVTMLRKYVATVSSLQQWWRQKSLELRKVRDSIAVRWEKLLLLEFAQEENTNLSLPVSSPRKPRQKPDSVEEPEDNDPNRKRVRQSLSFNLPREAQADRLLHIERELRARRYLLLPVLEQSEAELRAMMLKKAAGHADVSVFSYIEPPPSYIPADNEDGNQEILAMIRDAKSNSGPTWKDIKDRMRPNPLPEPGSGKGASLFASDDVQEEDLRYWKADSASMPGAGQFEL